MTTHPHPTRTPQAKVFITSAYSDAEPISTFREFAQKDRFQRHKLVSDPEEADIILFIENAHYHTDHFFSVLKNHKLVQQYPQKVFMYNSHDKPWYILPGIYMCMPKSRFNPTYMAAGPYVEVINTFIQCEYSREPAFLFSFYGATSSPPRYQIANLVHSRGKIVISNKGMYVENKPQDLQLQYAQLLTDSKFILCPRGAGPSSIRLFETLQAGRVPVIISDNFVCPKGLDWTTFAVFVAERDIHDIPSILEQQEASWPDKARRARQVWEDHFAPDTLFHYYVESILSLDKSQAFTWFSTAQHLLVLASYRFRRAFAPQIKSILKPIPLFKKESYSTA